MMGYCGDQINAMVFGGFGSTQIANSEKYSAIVGTGWLTTSSVNSLRIYTAGCGTADAALSIAGSTGAKVSTCELFSNNV